MKTLWILAAAATFAACHNRTDDETGAAPDRGDSTSVQSDTTMSPSRSSTDTAMTPTTAPSSGYDTTSTTNSQNPPSGQNPSTGYDTTSTTSPSTGGADSTSTSLPSSSGNDTTSTPISPSTGVGTDTTMSPSGGTDSVRVDSNSGSMQGDSALTNTNVPDSSSTQR